MTLVYPMFWGITRLRGVEEPVDDLLDCLDFA